MKHRILRPIPPKPLTPPSMDREALPEGLALRAIDPAESTSPSTSELPPSLTTKGPLVKPPNPRGYLLEMPLNGFPQRWLARSQVDQSAAMVRYLFLTHELSQLEQEKLTKLRAALDSSQHENLARILDIQVLGERMRVLCVVSEHLEGQCLGELRRLSVSGIFSPSELRTWLAKIQGALNHGRNKTGMPHGGLDPYTILISGNTEPKLLDYGIANCLTVSQRTPYAPAKRSRAEADDVYALGATLFECLSGTAPGLAPESIARLRETAFREPSMELEAVPKEWEQVIQECLSADPTTRPKSIDEVCQRMGCSRPTNLPAWIPKGRAFAVGASLFAMALGVIFAVAFSGSRRPAMAYSAPTGATSAANFQEGGKNSLGMRFAWLPHLGLAFGTHEVREKDWAKFASTKGLPLPGANTDIPISEVSWNEASAFCQWLNEKESQSKLLENFAYRLPTVGEWRAAAGFQGKYPWGDSWKEIRGQRMANLGGEELRTTSTWPRELRVIRGFQDDWPGLAPVESTQANSWGLSDMVGNLAEWCQDSHCTEEQPAVGGSWASVIPSEVESDDSVEWASVDSRSRRIGFRLVIAPQVKQ